MLRRTSIEAFHKIRENGLLSRLRWEVYETLFHHGPLTSGECWDWFHRGKQRSSISARMSELEAMGIVYQAQTRPCALTGHTAIAWDVTEGLPVRPAKKEKTKCQHCNGKGTL